MEIFEIRYFLGVAQYENLHTASGDLNVSPGSLSKAITRLEDELGVPLFRREGRGVKLTEHGKSFQEKAQHLIQIQESIVAEISGHGKKLRVTVAGPESLLSKYGIQFSENVRKKYAGAAFEFRNLSEKDAVHEVKNGNVHACVVTREYDSSLTSKVIGETEFKVYAGPGHPLYQQAKAGNVIDVQKVLTHEFVSPSQDFLGETKSSVASLDGWRDDKFPRKIGFRTTSLRMMENLVEQGQALAYLPDHVGFLLKATVVKISGCPYTCVQKVRLVVRDPKEIGWLNQVF